ncbi:MAG TPA: AAA family ATPase [Nitrososphaeraceae archaeon]|nr:AAA family ATPase [Nitrososphaeraceae archaeon]
MDGNISDSFRLVITGNPGVGKHTTAFELKKILDLVLIDINDLAVQHHAFLQTPNLEIDSRKIADIIESKLGESQRTVIVGHLAPYVLKKEWIDLTIVLRRSPYAILSTLESRNYSVEKIRENVASEILGVILYDSVQCFGKEKIAELDTTQTTSAEICEEIISLIKGKTSRKIGVVDWLSLVNERGDVGRFLEYS